MTSGRRSTPSDLKATLGTLIRSTLDQVGAMTEVARREAGRTRERIDDALHDRRRHAALAALGERVYDLYAAGQLELDDLPELVRAIERVEALDRRDGDADDHGAAAPTTPRAAWANVPRTGGSGGTDRSRRPATDGAPSPAAASAGDDDDDDLAEFMNPDDVPARPGGDDPIPGAVDAPK